MQEAIIAEQLLQRQVRSKRNITISSDAVDSKGGAPFFEYDILGLEFLRELSVDLISSSLDHSGRSWTVSYQPFSSLSDDTLDVSRSGGERSSAITSDQAEKQVRSEHEREQGEIYARIEHAKDELPTKTHKRLRQRFAVLFEFDDEESVRVSPGSVRQLLRFLRKDRKLVCPAITVTDRTNVKAIWRASDSQIFWIEFEPQGDVTYLAFVPNIKRSDGIERTSALSTIEDVLDRAREIGALAWMRS